MSAINAIPSPYYAAPLEETTIPLPAAYQRQVSYDYTKTQDHDPNVYNEKNTIQTPVSELDAMKDDENVEDEIDASAKRRKPLLAFLRDIRFYIRVLAVLVMIVSFALILTAIISFAKAINNPNHHLDFIPKNAPITDHPCIVFTGVSAMNLVFSCSIFVLSCMSSKFRKSNDAINASFAIISAVGFATSMGACFFLNKETRLQNDLWKWSCGNHKKGIVSDVIDFNLVCQVVSYGWRLGLVQASLELLTFIISIVAWILLKYSNFVHFGVFGKVF